MVGSTDLAPALANSVKAVKNRNFYPRNVNYIRLPSQNCLNVLLRINNGLTFTFFCQINTLKIFIIFRIHAVVATNGTNCCLEITIRP